MRADAFQSKLDEALKSLRHAAEGINHIDRTLTRVLTDHSESCAANESVPSTPNYPRKESRNGSKREWAKISLADWIQTGIGSLLLLTLIVSAENLKLANHALLVSKHQFVEDQRPYIWIKPEKPVIEAGKKLLWDVHLVNYGKSPALDNKTCVVGEWGTAPSRIGVVPEIGNGSCQKYPTSLVIPPNGDMYTSKEGDQPLSNEQVKIITSMDNGFVLRGVSEYSDATGNRYRSAFCLSRMATGAVASCGDNDANYIRQIKTADEDH